MISCLLTKNRASDWRKRLIFLRSSSASACKSARVHSSISSRRLLAGVCVAFMDWLMNENSIQFRSIISRHYSNRSQNRPFRCKQEPSVEQSRRRLHVLRHHLLEILVNPAAHQVLVLVQPAADGGAEREVRVHD